MTASEAAPRRPAGRRHRLLGWCRGLRRVGAVVAAMLVLLVTAAPGAAAFPPFDDCKSPPMPSDPAGGFLSTLDPMVLHDVISGPLPADATAIKGELITWYGYAGLQWTTYDLGCGGSVRDPGASVDTMFGGFFLWTAKALFAAQQGLEDLVYGDETGNEVTDAADRTGLALYDAIFSPWAGAALVIAGSIMMIVSRRGDVGEVLTRMLLVLVAVGIAALSFGSGAQMSRELSGTLRSTLVAAKNTVAAQAFPEQAESGPAYAMRDAIYQQILYTSWRNGAVGSYGRDDIAWELFQAQALDYNEWWAVLDAKVDQKQLFQDKGERWMNAADNRTTPTEYTNLQGKGESRTAAGAGALLMIAPIAVLQIFALLIQYLMFLFLAFLPAGAPLVALLGILKPDTPEKTVKVVGAVVFGGIVATICALVHSVVVMTMAGQGAMADVSMILLSWGSAVILYKLLKPIVALTGIFTSVRAIAGGTARRAGRVSRWIKAESRHRDTVRAGARQHQQLLGAVRALGGPPDGGPSSPGGGPPGSGGPRPDGPSGDGPRGGPRRPRPTSGGGGGATPPAGSGPTRGPVPGGGAQAPPRAGNSATRGDPSGGSAVDARTRLATQNGSADAARARPNAPSGPRRASPRPSAPPSTDAGRLNHTKSKRTSPGLYRPARRPAPDPGDGPPIRPRPEARGGRPW